MRIKISTLLFLLIITAVPVIAEEPKQLLVNSEDWRDVYSVMLYGSLKDVPAAFIVSDRHGTLILNSIDKRNHIWLISSSRIPYVVGYANIIRSMGYSVEEFKYDNANLELAKLTDTTSFIIVDDSYGYNAISVAPYAVVTKSYVLFVDKKNVREIERFLDERGVTNMIIYGHVDREVKERFAKYNPEIINKDGDRFANNIEIVKRYQKIIGQKQTILTNGEFIEKEIMSGLEPVIFIGVNNVPDVVREYIRNSDIEVGVLIGNELVGTATFIRRQLGISVFVKFAQGARAPRGAISQVEALDMFYLPTYVLNLEIESIKYNRATNKLEVTLRNTEEQAAYFSGTYSLTASDGSKQTVGDVEPMFIDGGELRTIVYDVEPMPEGKITADVYIIYGESKGSLERVIDATLEVEIIKVIDNCEMDFTGVTYNKRKSMFYVQAENVGPVDCYVDVELVDILIAGERNTFGMEKVAYIKKGETKKLRIKAELEEEDIEDNDLVKVRAFYGEREDGLVKTFEGEFKLVMAAPDYLFYSLLVVIIVLILLIIWKRYREKKRT